MNIKQTFSLRSIVYAASATLLLASCACVSNTTQKEELNKDTMTEETSPKPENPLDNVDTDVLIGMTKEEGMKFAKEHDVMFRVVKEDGQPYAVTRDYRPGRINATVVKNKIVDYFIEGKEKARPKPATDNDQKKDEFIGKTEEKAREYAKANDILFRVVMKDGEPLMVTTDHRPGRINATVVKGIVTEYTVE